MPDDAAIPAAYANLLRVGHNAFEFVLDFGQQFAASGEEDFHTRIVTNARSAANFGQTILAATREREIAMSGPSLAPVAKLPGGEARGAALIDLLRHLDALLERAYRRAQEVFEFQENGENRPRPYRGLYVCKDEVEQLLARDRAAAPLSAVPDDAALAPFSAPLFGAFGERLALTAFDQAAILLALAPELDSSFERISAYLQDDVSRRRPSVGLALEVLCPDAAAKLKQRSRFSADAPAMRGGLLRLAGPADAPLLDQTLRVEETVVAYLLGETLLDRNLAGCCRLLEWPVVTGADGSLENFARMLESSGEQAPVLYFQSDSATQRRRAAGALACVLQRSLVCCDLSLVDKDQAGQIASTLMRWASMFDAVVLLENADAENAALDSMLAALGQFSGVAILGGARPWVPREGAPRGVVTVPFASPDFKLRRELWQSSAASAEIAVPAASLDSLARFTLSADQILDCVASVRHRFALGSVQAGNAVSALMAAARGQSGSELAAVAQKIEPVYEWRDLVLPPDAIQQLREICDCVEFRHEILDDWGFGPKLSRGKGVAVLFSGPSGTGKTMAAEVIAHQLGLDLYRIDLSGVVSKYIGETEKNLEKIFASAERTNAILLFDEADALFGKRSEVRDSHDRYANIEVSYLLQRMEMYDGITILATNLRGNLDPAFLRRLTYCVQFPLPQPADRRRIWASMWPDPARVGPDVNFELFSEQFPLTGGAIRNIALAASSLAAAAGRDAVSNSDLLLALQREYQKLGKAVSQGELQGALAPSAQLQ